MNRRQFLTVAVSAGIFSFAGCAGDAESTVTPSHGVGDADQDSCANSTATRAGPQLPYDSLTLHQMPEYVTEYPESVIVQYQQLESAAQRAVQRALASDGAYRECTNGREQTDVMTLFSHIERRWEETGSESFDHTYLHSEGEYYGITLVQEGDFIRVESIHCTEEACPTTPTPPP